MSLLMITACMFVFWAGGLSVQINLLSLSLLKKSMFMWSCLTLREILSPISDVFNDLILYLKISSQTARKTVFYAPTIFANEFK